MTLRESSVCRAAKSSRWSSPGLLAVIASLGLLGSSAQADTIVSSLSNTLQTVLFTPSNWVASPFQTGPQGWMLTNVTLSLVQGGASASMADVRLFSNDVGQVGISLADLGVKQITGSQSQLWSFPATTDIELAPLTTYWVAVGNVSPDQGLNVDLVLAPPFSFTGAPGTLMTFSGAAGTGSGANPPTAFNPPGAGAALAFQADGVSTNVPEPGSFACLIAGGIALVVLRRLHRPAAV